MIKCTCGHTVNDMDDVWNCTLPEYTREGNRCLSYVAYCKECYDNADKLMNEQQENEWLDGKSALRDEESKPLPDFSEIRQQYHEARQQHAAENDAWWMGLTEKEREDAFYAVCKRIHKGDIVENRSYRGVLYDTFGFDPGMYVVGMDCGYMDIHNAIFDGEELQRMRSVTRVEVTDENGRSYSKWLDKDERTVYNLQDDNRTLKVFIDKTTWTKLF